MRRPNSRLVWILLSVLAVSLEAIAQTKPRHPVPPVPYDSVEVIYENKADQVSLSGTLTLPRTEGPFPAVVLVQGSNNYAFDRDQTERNPAKAGFKTFLMITDGLTRRGIAVLRVDERGAGKSTGSKTQSSIDSLAADALIAVDQLRGKKEIDPDRIGLLGMSFGGAVVPLAASKSANVKFVVTLAGPVMPFWEDIGPPALRKFAAFAATLIAKTAINETSQDALAAKLTDTLTELRSDLTAEQFQEYEPQMRDPAATAKLIAAVISPPLVRSEMLTGHREGPRNSKAPYLAIFGSRDTNVPPTTNAPALTSLLAQAGNADYTVTVVPGNDHSMWTCAPAQEGSFCAEEEFSPKVLELVGDWILRH